jgi:hypothetical protein
VRRPGYEWLRFEQLVDFGKVAEALMYPDHAQAWEELLPWEEFVNACITSCDADRRTAPRLPTLDVVVDPKKVIYADDTGLSYGKNSDREVRDDAEMVVVIGSLSERTLERLEALANLRKIFVHEMARATDATLFGLIHLQTIQSVVLRGAAITDTGIDVLSEWPALKFVDCRETSMSDRSVAMFAQHPAIRVLSVCNTQVSDKACPLLRSLPALASFSAEGTRITDRGVKVLGAIPSLINLNLTGTRVSDDCAPTIASLPVLRSLYLSNTSLGDTGLHALEVASKLRELGIRRTRVSHRALRCFREAQPECVVFR